MSAASLRLEGLSSSPEVSDLLDRWAVGDVSDAALEEAERRILSGEQVISDASLSAPPVA